MEGSFGLRLVVNPNPFTERSTLKFEYLCKQCDLTEATVTDSSESEEEATSSV